MSFPNQGTEESLTEYIQGTPYGTSGIDNTVVADIDSLLNQPEHPLNTGSDADDGTDRLEDEPGTTTPATPTAPSAESLQAQLDQVQAQAAAAQAALAQQEQQRVQAAQLAAQQEHQRIVNQIQQIEDPDAKRQAQIQYDAYRLSQQNQALQSENQQLKTQHDARVQAEAKEQVITGTIAQYGLPYSARAILATAQSPEHLDQIVAALVQTLPRQTTNQPVQNPQQQARLQQRLQSGAEAAGGAVASHVPPEGPKKHSGDIMGLIQNTRYNRVATRE